MLQSFPSSLLPPPFPPSFSLLPLSSPLPSHPPILPQHTTLTYASSSSVYGKDAPVPFATHSPPCAPSSMYAVTKTSNENFADAYCTQYGLRAVGLRFFTVYGPWGRPDMAVYKFADKIVTGRPVPLFEDAKRFVCVYACGCMYVCMYVWMDGCTMYM